jgi:hypothetical protein
MFFESSFLNDLSAKKKGIVDPNLVTCVTAGCQQKNRSIKKASIVLCQVIYTRY